MLLFHLNRYGLHPGGSWSLSWVALAAAGVLLADFDSSPALVGRSVLAALFAGLTLVGALAFAGRTAPLWILPAALGCGLVRALVWSTWGEAPAQSLTLLYEPGPILAGAVITFRAPLLVPVRTLRWSVSLALGAVALLEAWDALAPVFPELASESRTVWFAAALTAAFLETGALWYWIARREVRLERAEQEQRELEGEVAHERHTTELLRRKEAWLFDFFEKAPDMLVVLTPGTCEIQRCNRKFSESLGYARKDLEGRSLLDFVDSGTLDAVRPALTQPRRRLRNLALRLVRHDASGLEVLANLALRSDTHGRQEVRAVLHDITRLRRTDGETPDPKDFYRSLTAQLPVGVFHCDDDGRCRLVNPSFCEISGLSSERARDHGWLASVHPEDHPAVLSALRAAVRHGSAFRARHRVTPRAGVVHRVLTECVPRLDGPGFVGSVVLLDDPDGLETMDDERDDDPTPDPVRPEPSRPLRDRG